MMSVCIHCCLIIDEGHETGGQDGRLKVQFNFSLVMVAGYMVSELVMKAVRL